MRVYNCRVKFHIFVGDAAGMPCRMSLDHTAFKRYIGQWATYKKNILDRS